MSSSSSSSSSGLENLGGSLNDNGKDDYYHHGRTSSTPATSSNDIEPWTISVKTVGGGFDEVEAAGTTKTTTSNSTSFAGGGERLYTVTVCPEDRLESLHKVIEKETGVKPSQQRLIYRGRLIELDSTDDETSTSRPGSGSSSASSYNNQLQIDEISGSTSNTNDEDDGTNSEGVSDQRRQQPPNSQTTTKETKTIRVKDIKGLSSGQTIHLVKKRVLSDGGENDNGRTSTQSSSSSESSSVGSSRPRSLFSTNSRPTPLGDSLGGGGEGGGGGALLAALLGLGSIAEESSSPGIATTNGEPSARLVAANNNSDAAGTRTRRTAAAAAAAAAPSSTGASRLGGTATATAAGAGGSSFFGRTSHRRPHYRYSIDDLRAPNPGSMESVRQGLMTLHTLLPHSQLHREDGTSPLQANREWFRGQWCDVRDTVNQWLEATVVEILLPHEVLPEASSFPRYDVRRPPRVDTDPAIHADDLEGRRRLLVEACDPGDPNELDGELAGFRPRRTNHGVQLLLVHYNGWPHRWDEWIRSDSERIRPFRTRTRHPTQSSHVAPTPQSVFTEAPRTNILSGDDEDDREALLPELYRVMTQITSLLGEMVDLQQVGDGTDQRHRRVEENLPWLVSSNDRGLTPLDEDDGGLLDLPAYNVIEPHDETGEDDVDSDRDALGTSAVSATSEPSERSSDSRPMYTQREMRNLATMLDRLGRTLTDAAPHVHAHAAAIPDPTISSSSAQEGSGLLSVTNTANTAAEHDHSSSPLGGILSLWSSSRERRRQSSAEVSGSLEGPQEAARIDPDHVDYANGLVNTTRGEVRSGPRNRSSNDDLAALLGSYLAAMSLNSLVNGDSDGGNLGALLRGSTDPDGGGATGRGEGGELAIHIQAVFTSPGNLGGTGGVAGSGVGAVVGGAGPATAVPVGGTRGLFSSVRNGRSSLLRSRSNQFPADSVANSEDDESLFSDLYSENPAPIDPNADNGSTPSPSTPSSRSTEGGRSSFGGTSISNSTASSAQNSTSHNRFSRQPRRRSSERRGSGLLRVFRRRSRNEDS